MSIVIKSGCICCAKSFYFVVFGVYKKTSDDGFFMYYTLQYCGVVFYNPDGSVAKRTGSSTNAIWTNEDDDLPLATYPNPVMRRKSSDWTTQERYYNLPTNFDSYLSGSFDFDVTFKIGTREFQRHISFVSGMLYDSVIIPVYGENPENPGGSHDMMYLYSNHRVLDGTTMEDYYFAND